MTDLERTKLQQISDVAWLVNRGGERIGILQDHPHVLTRDQQALGVGNQGPGFEGAGGLVHPVGEVIQLAHFRIGDAIGEFQADLDVPDRVQVVGRTHAPGHGADVGGFGDLEQAVRDGIQKIEHSAFVASNKVRGFIYSVESGKLTEVA
mgnify:CR=1 FL=1